MKNLINRFRLIASKSTFSKDERGLSTVEYVIVLVLIAAAAVGAWNKFGSHVKGKITASDDKIQNMEKADGDSSGDSASGKETE